MSTLSDNPRLCRMGDIFALYPYIGQMSAYRTGENKQMCKYAQRVYQFKKQGLMREFFQQKIIKISKDIGAEMIAAVPGHETGKIGTLQEIFGSVIIREKTVPATKYQKGIRSKPEDSCSLSVDITGKNILLVDDICKTGSTMHAFRSYLEQNGGKVVGMLACGMKFSAADYIPEGFKDGTFQDELGTGNIPDELKEDTPVTSSEYARTHNMSQQAVMKAARTGRLQWNGKVGRECRVWGTLKHTQEETEDHADLNVIRSKKLKVETELKRQQLKENQEAQWRAFADATCEDYLAAFAPLSARLTEMRLPAPKLAALRKVVEECTADFMRRQKRRYEDHEPENA